MVKRIDMRENFRRPEKVVSVHSRNIVERIVDSGETATAAKHVAGLINRYPYEAAMILTLVASSTNPKVRTVVAKGLPHLLATDLPEGSIGIVSKLLANLYYDPELMVANATREVFWEYDATDGDKLPAVYKALAQATSKLPPPLQAAAYVAS
jgi:hypothetical protein